MKVTDIPLSEVARTFTLIARPDTHLFLEDELPGFVRSLRTPPLPLRRYIAHLRSGEYIPKDAYSDEETDYVYLTIGQFSGASVAFDGLTFLDPTVGRTHEEIAVRAGSLVVTRSGTVGVVHVFRPPDDKVYIPSHHLAIVELPDDMAHSADYLRMYLQTPFARRYFWAFASGKGQKEISNWSIKSIPIPQVDRPSKVAKDLLRLEAKAARLRQEADALDAEKAERLIGLATRA